MPAISKTTKTKSSTSGTPAAKPKTQETKVDVKRAVAAKPAKPVAPAISPKVMAKAVAKPVVQAPKPVAKPVVPPAPRASDAAVAALPLPPAALRAVDTFEGVTQTSLSKAKDVMSQVQASGDALASGFSQSGEAATKGMQSFQEAFVGALQAQADATLDYFRELAEVRTFSDMIELQARHARNRFETAAAQAKTLAGIASRTAQDTAAPVREALNTGLGRGFGASS